MSDNADFTSPKYHYKQIHGYVTGAGYDPSIEKTVPQETRLSHILGEAEKLATDSLYDLLTSMNTERVEWLRSGRESEAACYGRMIEQIEAKINSIKISRGL